jgi:hypothetical protein
MLAEFWRVLNHMDKFDRMSVSIGIVFLVAFVGTFIRDRFD